MITPKPIPTDNPSGALIGYNNLLTGATISGDSSVPSKALIPNTWERWRPTATTVTAKFQMAILADVDFIAIAAHAMAGETVLIQTATVVSGTLTDLESITFPDNKPVMITFDTRNIIEVALTMTLAAANEIGVVYAGKALQMERSIYGGHTPQALSQNTEYQNVKSESGQTLGRNITRLGSDTDFSWQYLSPDWYREMFQPFVEAARTTPFFIMWRPDLYDTEVAFCQTTKDIKPVNMGGGHGLLSVKMDVEGHSDVF